MPPNLRAPYWCWPYSVHHAIAEVVAVAVATEAAVTEAIVAVAVVAVAVAVAAEFPKCHWLKETLHVSIIAWEGIGILLFISTINQCLNCSCRL